MKIPDRGKVFVFDLAGVLVEWNMQALYGPMFSHSGRDDEFFFTEVFGHEIQARISAGTPIMQLIHERQHAFPEWHEEIAAYWLQWDRMLVGNIDGTVSVAAELRERGYRLYVLGNWSREEFDRARSRLSFLGLFEDVLISGDCGILKPDPGIYALAESRFGLVPENTIFIDDRADNVEAALTRNWNGIMFENPRKLYLTLMDYGLL